MGESEGAKQSADQEQKRREIVPIEARLKKIEEKLDSKKKDFWDRLQASSTLISSIGAAILAFFLTGSVNQALQQRQYELSAVKEMKDSIAAFNKPDLSEADAMVKASELAAYGPPAVPALINFLQSSNIYSVHGAERGLRFVGSLAPDAVCPQVTSIIRNRSGLYTFRTHRRALEIIGDLSCSSSLPDVANFRREIDSKDVKTIVTVVSDSDMPEVSDLKELQLTAHNTEERLSKIPKPGLWDRMVNWLNPKRHI